MFGLQRFKIAVEEGGCCSEVEVAFGEEGRTDGLRCLDGDFLGYILGEENLQCACMGLTIFQVLQKRALSCTD